MKKQLLLTLVAVIGLTNLSIFAQTGFTCNQAIAITSLPYTTTDNTANYGDTYDVIQPSSCVTASGNYMGGNDVFYSYTPTANETINIKMTPTSGWSGIFVYDGCSNVGVTCVGGVANSSNALREIASLNVISGHNYIIAISTFPTPQTVGYTLQIQSVTCATPNLLTTNSITTNSLNLAWNNSANSNSWEVYVAPCGTTAPSATTSGTVITSNPYTINGLNPATCYTIYVRSICSPTEMSLWSNSVTITTLSTPAPAPVCGGQFTDNGGLTSVYANSSDDTYIICPTNPGEQVTVTFTSFDTEPSFDGLYVFDGSSITAPQISSSNGTGSVPGVLAGSYWGTTIPGPFTSTDPSGCLTFRFRSDGSVNKAGWVANVECFPPASCVKPTIDNITNITLSEATVNWTENGTATQWEVFVTPSIAPAPTNTAVGVLTSSNPYILSGLTQGDYKVYVRSICSTNDSSIWSNPKYFSIATCSAPIIYNATGTTNFTWDANNFSSWEVIVLPSTSAQPTASSVGTIVNVNSYQASGLACGSNYKIYVRSFCNATIKSNWSSLFFTTPTCSVTNGQPVNMSNCNDSGTSCFNLNDNNTAILGTTNPSNIDITYYNSLSNATSQTNPLPPQYCLTNSTQTIYAGAENILTFEYQIFNFTVSSSSVLPTVVLSGINQCDDNGDGNVVFDLTNNPQITTINPLSYYTSLANAVSMTSPITNTISYSVPVTSPSVTIFIRESITNDCDKIYSMSLSANSDCNLAHNCNLANSLCSALGNPFTNTHQGINAEAGNGNNYGCLFSTPNPTWFYLPVSSPGNLNLTIEQSTSINFVTNNLDVDYIIYGPFTNPITPCAAGLNQSNTVSCSYSGAAVEHPVIPNAQVGEYYLLMVTNFSNQPGFIRINMDTTSTGAIDCSGLRLNAFLDNNGNGNQDNGEVNFPLGQFHYSVNNGSVHNIIAPTGIYNIYDINGTNSYNFDFTVNPSYSTMYNVTTPSYSNINVVIGGGMVTYNFPITVTQSYNDVAVNLVPFNSPRTGSTYQNKLVYTNLGNQTISSGTLTFNNDAATSITAVSQSGITNIPNGFTYTFSNLLPFETRVITITLQVPTIPTVSIGQLLTNTASIIPPVGDLVTSNDTSLLTQAIIGAYDPNDKIESHGERILFSTFNPNDYLFYTIRFENTGTASAINVKVNDILDSKIDETSLQMVSASHEYTMDRVNTNLTWSFNNIQLPVSVANTNIGKGYITFKVKLKPGFSAGDIIPNTASIYFDTNPAIITNTFQTEFVAALSNTIFESNNLLIYPNPTNSSVQINLQNTTEKLSSLVIYDVVGKTIKTIKNSPTNDLNLDVSDLSKGVYLVEITTETNLKLTKKLIIQ